MLLNFLEEVERLLLDCWLFPVDWNTTWLKPTLLLCLDEARESFVPTELVRVKEVRGFERRFACSARPRLVLFVRKPPVKPLFVFSFFALFVSERALAELLEEDTDPCRRFRAKPF